MDRIQSPDTTRALATARERLARGQAHEARGELKAALGCYEEARAGLTKVGPCAASPIAPDVARLLALIAMNRGNALQKLATRAGCMQAVAAYDRAIAGFDSVLAAAPGDHGVRNSLGAAHLNRASALLALDAPASAAEALAATGRAIAVLTPLATQANLSYRANLTGAWLNRATALLGCDLAAAREAARTALTFATSGECEHLVAAQAALGARCTLLAILGRQLAISAAGNPCSASPDTLALLEEASDVIDEGLAVARLWEGRHTSALRPAAARLFHAGAVLYASRQPHFVAEFLEENRGLASALPAVVQTMLERAHRSAQERARLGDRAADPLARTVTTLAELRLLAERFASLVTLRPQSA